MTLVRPAERGEVPYQPPLHPFTCDMHMRMLPGRCSLVAFCAHSHVTNGHLPVNEQNAHSVSNPEPRRVRLSSGAFSRFLFFLQQYSSYVHVHVHVIWKHRMETNPCGTGRTPVTTGAYLRDAPVPQGSLTFEAQFDYSRVPPHAHRVINLAPQTQRVWPAAR